MLRLALVAGLLIATPPARGAEPQPGDFDQGYTVSGRVMSEPGGLPLRGCLVMLGSGTDGSCRTARTNQKGEYSFPGTKPGDGYAIWIKERPGREAGVWSEWSGIIVVEDRPVRADDLFATLPQSLSGTVTDIDTGMPVAGADIFFFRADRSSDSIRTDADGGYRLFVTPRDVEIYCRGTDDRHEPSERPRRAAVGEGKHVKGIDFKVKISPPFSVLVVNPDGTPARAADVFIEMRWPEPSERRGFAGVGTGRDRWFKTDADGRVTGYLQGSRGSEFVELRVAARTLDHRTGGVATAKTSARDDHRLDTIKVALARSSGFIVRVLDPDGKVIPGATVSPLNFLGSDYGLWGPVKNLGEGGHLMTGLVPGLDYRLKVTAPGFRDGPEAKPLVLKPDEVRELDDVRLEWWGKKAVPGLVKQLQSADIYARETAAHLLGELGADAADAVPALVEKLKNDPRSSVRYGVALALGKIGPPARSAVPDLVKSLQEDAASGVQREAATALGRIGDLSALPALKTALEHKDGNVRQTAAEAIKRLDEWAKKRPLIP